MTQQKTSPLEGTGAPAWHSLDAAAVITRLHTDSRHGLSAREAERRLQQYGANTLETGRKVHWHMILVRQFVDVLIFILLVAAAISVAVGEMADAVTIMVIVVLNGVLGFIQEWKAERAIEALQRMLAPHCKVVRDGHEQAIDAKVLVPGDIVVLEIGDRVPGDLRLVEALDLRLDESSLTGESESVSKGIDRLTETLPLPSAHPWPGWAQQSPTAAPGAWYRQPVW